MLDDTPAGSRATPLRLHHTWKKSIFSKEESSKRRAEANALTVAYRDHQRPADFARLVELAQPLLKRWANIYDRQGIDFDDAMQIAILALEKAARKFRPEENGASIFTYAAFWIHDDLNVAKQSLGLSGIRGMATIVLSIRKEIREHGNDVEAGLAAYAEKSRHPRTTIDALYWGSEPLPSIFNKRDDDESGACAATEKLSDDTTEDTFLDPIEHRAQLRDATFAIETVIRAEKIPERARRIFYGIYREGRTLDALSNDEGISRERVRQIAIRLMKQVRAAMGIKLDAEPTVTGRTNKISAPQADQTTPVALAA